VAGRVAGVGLTFLAVVVAWVFFRAPSLDAASNVLQGMAGLRGVVLPEEWRSALAIAGVRFGHLESFGGTRQLVWVGVLLAIAWVLPNTQEVVAWLKSGIAARARAYVSSYSWPALGVLSVLISLLAMINGSRGVSEFIYFNF